SVSHVPPHTPSPFLLLLLSTRMRRLHGSPLFPYTTLFRSLSLALLADALDAPSEKVSEALLELTNDYKARESGVEVREMAGGWRSEEHTSELQSLTNLVCPLLLEITR